jgi:DNA-cytosine methyltransferase
LQFSRHGLARSTNKHKSVKNTESVKSIPKEICKKHRISKMQDGWEHKGCVQDDHPNPIWSEGRGTADSRGLVVYRVCKIIRKLRPDAFLLENVRGLVVKHKRTFAAILEMLNELEGYKIHWKVLDSRHHGVPMSRPRVFIVGLRLAAQNPDNPFQWPAMVAMPPLAQFLENHDGDGTDACRSFTARRNHAALLKLVGEKTGGMQALAEYVGDLSSSKKFGATCMRNCVPCLTAGRAGGGGHYLFGRRRLTTTVEMFRLMGVPDGRIVAPAGVTQRQLKTMIGNSMDVHVLSRVLARLLTSIGREVVDALGSEGEVAT